ncbi:MAG: hypothetical protein JW780_02320 [Clostridiales bacterium]|nr:hypothetical protein [Clostridiales bacterium]
MSDFRLPVWLSAGMVFQQKVPVKICGSSAPQNSVTLEVVKDPTDGRKVSKLDTDYGVILSLETRTNEEGEFTFELPPYKASTDNYTFIFHSGLSSRTIKDIRCGDVWVMLGSRPLHVPIFQTAAPRAPLKKSSLGLIRLLSPARTGLKEGESYSFAGSTRDDSATWIHVRDSALLSRVSSTAFSMAYHLADQLHYPIGIIDLALDGASILSWISREVIEKDKVILAGLKEKRLYLSEMDWTAFFSRSKEPVSDSKKAQDHPSVGNVKTISAKEISDALIRHDVQENITAESLMTVMYSHKLLPLKEVSIRGIVYAPDCFDSELVDMYPKLMRGLLMTMASVFGPKEVDDEGTGPSLILLQVSPENLDPKKPERYLELNEALVSIRRKFPMSIGILGQHDILLPEKTKSFAAGQRLARIALGIHFTQKMPSSSPECIGVEIVSNKVMMTFDNTVDGLRLAENESVLRGFSICGEDRVYRPANAKILHEIRVMVWHDDIPEPAGVTYGYSPVPHLATFRNRADLPVLPFRFDREKSTYAPDLSFATCDFLEITARSSWDRPFERLPVYKTIKGTCDIIREDLNKTQGSASLHLKYETENSLFVFGPVLDYVTLFAPLDLTAFRKIAIDIFNPDLSEKKLSIEGFSGEVTICSGLRWQTLMLEVEGEDKLLLSRLEMKVFDTNKKGELYVDNIRFLP